MSNTTFFSNGAGAVVAFTDPGLPSVAAVRVSGFEGFTSTRSIITRVGFSKQANVQFRHTVGGAVHIYTFGDRIGEAVISGLCFDNGCDGNEFSGLEKIVDYYTTNRVSERGNPITITLGARLGLLAYLIGVQCDVAETTSRVYQYSLRLVLVPDAIKPPAALSPGERLRQQQQEFEDRRAAQAAAANEALRNHPADADPDAPLGAYSATPNAAPFNTPGWGNTPTSDIGGAHANAHSIPYPPTPGFVNYGTGPSTQLTRGYN